MALLQEAQKEKHFDLRVVERNLSRNVIKKSELDQFLKSLPDDAEAGIYGDEEEQTTLDAQLDGAGSEEPLATT